MIQYKEYEILKYLYLNNLDTPWKCITSKEIANNSNIGVKILRIKQLCFNLIEMGFVEYGYVNGRAKTFFITEKGKEFIDKKIDK